jgi:release factor glutamine methyltransferase
MGLFPFLCQMQWKMNKLTDLKKQYLNDLLPLYEKREAESLLAILVQHFFGLSRASLLAKSDFRLSESEMLQLHFAVKELKKYRPVQYIIGETEFFGLNIKVNDAVLIPRPETEELIQLIVANEKKQGLHILDIGTGSGCIAIALAKSLSKAQLTGIDISTAALELASENCAVHAVDILLMEMNILDRKTWNATTQYELIVSNPPYVTHAERSRMQENVLGYEPHQALFVPDNKPLLFYESIFEFSMNHLKKKGRFYVEINETKANAIAEMADARGFIDVIIHKDIHGKNRFVSGVKK